MQLPFAEICIKPWPIVEFSALLAKLEFAHKTLNAIKLYALKNSVE